MDTIKDVEITRLIGIPSRTLQDWKNGKGWRYKVYLICKEHLAKDKNIEITTKRV